MPLSKIVANSITDNTITTDQIADTSVHGRRNLVINGAMQVAQRSTSQTGLTSGTFATLDRFRVSNAGRDEHVYTEAQVSDAPDGFVNSFKVTTTTAETSIDANDAFWVQHIIEAQNLQHLQNGSSGALSTTLSFYVKSSQTGTFGVNLYKPDNTARVINSTYTISSADTWEYKTITFAGDTAGGGIDNNNGEGLRVVWHLAAGSNYDSANSTSWINYSTANWAGGHAQDGVITTTNATWQITGVQFEVGNKATPFEHRSFSEEEQLCFRYYYDAKKANADQGNSYYFAPLHRYDSHQKGVGWEFVTAQHPVRMRAAPTITLIDGNGNTGKISHWTSGGGNQTHNHNPYTTESKEMNITISDYSTNGIYGFYAAYRADAEL